MKRTTIIIGAAALLLAGAGLAMASIPDSAGVIHACRDAKTGALRVVDTDAGQSCAKGEAALAWNQTGPQGPQGPAGTNGVSGYEQVFRNWSGPWPAGVVNDFFVDCPTGKVALGGGFDASAGASILASWPSNVNYVGVRWNIRVEPTTQLDYVTVFATCASVN